MSSKDEMMQITIRIPHSEYNLMMRLKSLKGYGLVLKEGESQLDVARDGQKSGWFNIFEESPNRFEVFLSPAGIHLITMGWNNA